MFFLIGNRCLGIVNRIKDICFYEWNNKTEQIRSFDSKGIE